MTPRLLMVLAVAALGHDAAAEVLKTTQDLAPPLGVDHLGYADGLPNSDVHAIIQDSQGFIWLGTQDGLARYDGVKVKVYRPKENDATSISGTFITALALDPSGKLWVGTGDAGVDLYDPDTDKFTRFRHGQKDSISSDSITAIARDSKGRMWFAGATGLDKFEPATSTFAQYLNELPIVAIDVNAPGVLWLGVGNNEGVVKWNPDDNSQVAFRPIPGDEKGLGAAPVKTLLTASTGMVWIGTDGDGLFALDPKTKAFTHVRHSPGDPGTLSDDHIKTLFEDRHHDLWIGTTAGLDRMKPNGRIAQYHNIPSDPTSIPFPEIESIYQDAGNVMWIGGFTEGACKFDEQREKFGHYRTLNHPANSFLEDPDGTLWVGTYNGGLYHYDWANQRVTTYHSLGRPGEPGSVALESVWITQLLRDHAGVMWLATKGQGLIAFDPKAETYRQYMPAADKVEKGLPVDTILDMYEDDAGQLWLATYEGGLVRLDPKREAFATIAADESIGLASNSTYRLYPDPLDRKVLWLGLFQGGLVQFNTQSGTGKAFRHRKDDLSSLSNDDVTSIFRDPSGAMWVGTYGGGLNRLDIATGKAERFTMANSQLPNDVLHGILADEEGKLWLSTNGGGLVQFDPKTKKLLVYDATDGVQSNEFGQGSFLRGKSGKLYFGGVGGFNMFTPKDITRDPYVPPVVLTALKIFNQEVKLDRPVWTLPALKLSYSDSFEIQFAALSFAAPGRNRYAYKLEGFDSQFIETDRPFATYTKLDGGNYTLRVRAANKHGAWNETGIALKLSVSPPLWRTWPAFALYVLLLAGLVYMVFRYQQNKVRRIEREGRLAVVERDLELSGAVQSGFLPENSEIAGNHLHMFGFYRAADACSGDWWWHESFGDRHLILVGDVTGHGPGPAMVTAAVATAFRVLTGNGISDVDHALDLLNRVVVNVAKGKYHMTMAALELEDATGRWILHSAGAPPMLTLDGAGKHKVHFCPGAPLGTEGAFETGRVEGRLNPNDRILIYTDGIPEIALPNGSVLGMRRFAQMYERTRNHNLRDAAAAIVQLADQTQSGKRQADDWTFTLIEWGGRR